MPVAFRIRYVPELDAWVPNHPELKDMARFSNDATRSEILQGMWFAIDSLLPGQYELDEAVTLADMRNETFLRIDMRTVALIEVGFAYQGVRFSLSLHAQTRYNAMLAARQLLTYPLAFNSLDDLDSVTLTSENDVLYFCATALGFVRDQIDSGTQLKQAVRDATTPAELEAIVDPRPIPST